MKLTLKNNEVVKYKSWDDSVFTVITRKNNTVEIETFSRYAPYKKRKLTYEQYKDYSLKTSKIKG